MDTEEIEENKPEPHFYKLDETKHFSVVGGAVRGISVMFIVAAVIILMTVIAAVASKGAIFEELNGMCMFAVFLAAAVVSIVAGIFLQVKRNAKVSAEKRTLSECIITDGVVTACKTRTIGKGKNTYKETEILYTFTDCTFNKRSGQVKLFAKESNLFDKGKSIIVAFNDSQSFILDEFTLKEEDEKQLIAQEQDRMEKCFESLDGELEEIDMSHKIITKEMNFVYLILAGCLGVIAVLLCLPFILVTVNMFKEGFATAYIIIDSVLALFPVFFVSLAVWFIVKYFKKEKRIKKILKGRTFFTWGKVFVSRQTYRNKTRKKVYYCYIDKWGERHVEELKVAVTDASVNDCSAIIAYLSDGSSVALDTFVFAHPEYYEYGEEDCDSATNEKNTPADG